MARDVGGELVMQHEYRIVPAKPAELQPDLSANSRLMAGQIDRMVDVNQRPDAIVQITGMVEKLIKINGVNGRTVNSIADISRLQTEIDRGATVVGSDGMYWAGNEIVDAAAICAVTTLSSNSEMRDLVVKAKNPKDLEHNLGIDSGPLVGIGEIIMRNMVTDKKLRGRLVSMQNMAEAGSLTDTALQAVFAEIQHIVDDADEGSRTDTEGNMIMSYISSLRGGIEQENKDRQTLLNVENEKHKQEVLKQGRDLLTLQKNKEAADENRRRQEASMRQHQHEQAQVDDILSFAESMLIHQSEQNADPFSQMAPEWMRDYPDKALLQKVIELQKKAYFKLAFGNQYLDEIVDPKGRGVYLASNEMMGKMYEIPGVKESKEHIIGELFEPYQENGVFMLRLKGWGAIQVVRARDGEANYKNSPEYKAYKANLDVIYGNIREWQMEWVRRLENSGVNGIDSATEALLGTAIAWDQLFVGHAWESADVDKEIPTCEVEVAQAWAFCHPRMKAINKMSGKDLIDTSGVTLGTEEAWGGTKGTWVARRFEMARAGSLPDQQFVTDFLSGKETPFPERLFCSFVENSMVIVWRANSIEQPQPDGTVVLVDGYVSVSEAEALAKREKIEYSQMNKSSDPWGGYYDLADSANKLYQATTGKMEAPFTGDEKGQKATEDWLGKVADARNKLRGNKLLRTQVDNPEFVAWAIAASIPLGLFKESSDLVLMTADVNIASHDLNMDYYLRYRDLIVDKKERNRIRQKFNCGGPASRARRKQIQSPITRKSGVLKAVTNFVKKITG